MLTNIKPDPVADRRWQVLHVFYIVIFTLFLLLQIYGFKTDFFTRLTNVLLLQNILLLYGLWFARSRLFTLRYIMVPAFGLTMVVFIIRFLFEVLAGTEWLAESHFSFAQENSDAIPITLYRFGDTVLHFIPFLVLYQIAYIYEEAFKNS